MARDPRGIFDLGRRASPWRVAAEHRLVFCVFLSAGCRRPEAAHPAPTPLLRHDASRAPDTVVPPPPDTIPPDANLDATMDAATQPVHEVIASLRARLLAVVPAEEAAEIAAIDLSDTLGGAERQIVYLLWDVVLRRLLPASVSGADWRVAPIVDFDSLQAARDVVYAEGWSALLNENSFGYAECQREACSREAVRKASCNSPVFERTKEALEAFLDRERPPARGGSLAGDATVAGPTSAAERIGRPHAADASNVPTNALLDAWQYGVIGDLFAPRQEGCRRATSLASETLWELAFVARHHRRAHARDRPALSGGFPLGYSGRPAW